MEGVKELFNNNVIDQRFSPWMARLVGIGIGVLTGGLMLAILYWVLT